MSGPGQQPGPALRRGQRRPAERQGDGGGRPAPGDVVVQVAEELLEARVEVGGERDKQQIEVEGQEAEGGAELPEPQPVPCLLGLVRQVFAVQLPG